MVKYKIYVKKCMNVNQLQEFIEEMFYSLDEDSFARKFCTVDSAKGRFQVFVHTKDARLTKL